MKRTIDIVLCLCLMVAIGGCGKDGATVSDDKYKVAAFSDYNSFASDNGRGGDKVSVSGIFDTTRVLEDKLYSYLKQPDGYEWILIFGLASEFDANKIEENLLHQEITVHGVYTGFSGTQQRPVVEIDKVIYDKKEFLPIDFAFKKADAESSKLGITVDNFIEKFTESVDELGATGGEIHDMPVVQSENGIDNSYSYMIDYDHEVEGTPWLIADTNPPAHMAINANGKTGIINNISIFAETSSILNADGSKAPATNTGLHMSVNIIAVTLDKAIDIEDFSNTMNVDGVGNFNNFDCSTNKVGEFESYIFTLN